MAESDPAKTGLAGPLATALKIKVLLMHGQPHKAHIAMHTLVHIFSCWYWVGGRKQFFFSLRIQHVLWEGLRDLTLLN